MPVGRAINSGHYKRVVFVTGAQIAKTETFLDVIGQRADERPAPILYVGPTKQFVVEQFEPRIMAMLDGTPRLAAKVARGKRMTKTRKLVAGVPIRLAHGGSSAALKADPAALAIVDEYDDMVRNVKGQGDPLGLVEARGFTYADFCVAVASTPSVGSVDLQHDDRSGLDFWRVAPPGDIESPIWAKWQEGTRYHWTWQCPECRDWFIPRFRLLRWHKGATPAEARRDTWIECPVCSCEIREDAKVGMNAAGRYVAPGQTIDADGCVSGDPPDSSTVSFWCSGLASPFVSFGERAEAFLKATASGDQHQIRTVINTGFGELYAPGGGEAPEVIEVYKLKAPYRLGDVPDDVRILTAGIDVQKNRLVYVVRGWGARATSWLVAYGELWGATDQPDVWGDLSDLLEEPIGDKRIRLALIDSGFRPNKRDAGPEHAVYEFCRRHQRIARPSKGYDQLRAPVVVSRLEVTPAGAGAKYGIELVRINTDFAKLWVHERIRWPQDQPGAFHLPEDISDDYCAQLISEARVKKPSGRAQWVQRSHENHALDAEAMAYSAGYLLNVQRIPPHAEPKPPPREPDAEAAPAVPDAFSVPRPPIVPRATPRMSRSAYLAR